MVAFIFERDSAPWYTSAGVLERTRNGTVERSLRRFAKRFRSASEVHRLDQVNTLCNFSHMGQLSDEPLHKGKTRPTPVVHYISSKILRNASFASR